MKHIPVLMFTMVLALTACGGGGGGTNTDANNANGSQSTSLAITGTAATGAALSNSTVDVKCKSGTGTATTNADGTYSVTVTNGVGPCIIRVVDPITKFTAYSFVEADSKVANVNPVTHLIVANALGDDPSNAFNDFSTSVQNKITTQSINTATNLVISGTAVLGADGDMTGVDVMKGSMRAATANAAGDSTDKKLDALMASLAAADKKIADLTAQLKVATSNSDSLSKMTTLIGDAKYSLVSCPYARSGNVWVLDLVGLSPILYNVDFNDPSNMKLKDLRDNSVSVINVKRDSSSNTVPCAFTSIVKGSLIEFRVSDGGIGSWIDVANHDFGMIVPQQKTNNLTDASFVGAYPSMAFIQKKTSPYTRGALPIAFNVGSDGKMKAYSCDMTKTIPDCLSEVSNSSPDTTTCTPISNGSLNCTSTGGMAATAVLYTSGSQTTMFMAITNMNVGGVGYGGLLVMTKAASIKLPTSGQSSAAGSAWFAGIDPGSSNTVYSGTTSQSTVETVDTATNSYTSSSAGSSVITTNYINTPSAGLAFSKIGSTVKAVGIGSPTGWSLAVVLASPGVDYNGWFAYIRAKR